VPRKPSAAAEFIGARIEEARIKDSMTYDDLASKTGIDSSNIRSYTSGRATPSVQSLIRISAALGQEPGYFINGLTAELFDLPRRRDKAS